MLNPMHDCKDCNKLAIQILIDKIIDLQKEIDRLKDKNNPFR